MNAVLKTIALLKASGGNPRSVIAFIIILGSVLGLHGCGTVPVVSESPSVPGEVQGAQTAPAPQSQTSPATAAPTTLTAQAQFIKTAKAAQQAQDWSGAIEQAERGLRIDRRQPQLYLILAQSYWQLGKSALASQFARQGLRYLGQGSEVLQQQLEQLAYP